MTSLLPSAVHTRHARAPLGLQGPRQLLPRPAAAPSRRSQRMMRHQGAKRPQGRACPGGLATGPRPLPASRSSSADAAPLSPFSAANCAASSANGSSPAAAEAAAPQQQQQPTLKQQAAASNQEVYDRLIEAFEQRSPEEWRKLIAFSKQWPMLAQGVLDRCGTAGQRLRPGVAHLAHFRSIFGTPPGESSGPVDRAGSTPALWIGR